ncbi:uncharacterized protein LOC106869148 isoform X2 [Octopus bimaculoides]|uniref:Death domain-containing protein n=1 Tax=Octopus bimaculoides TaxID=37653 RepID=A0A0L8IGL7_OCTBM|nr:uncharacterized protein LOC106869148 isoform X2 [Octopus bimaculoides]|eukprot:XP_014770247.1 PREDICTED: uncharacterized protein LOC106869148 isoform X2 [Octopus bimaculoides]
MSDAPPEELPTIDRASVISEKSLTLIAKHINSGLSVIRLGMMLNIPNTVVLHYLMSICGKYGLRDATEKEVHQLGTNLLIYWLRMKENSKPKEKASLLTTALAECSLEGIASVVLENYNNHTEITEEQFSRYQ